MNPAQAAALWNVLENSPDVPVKSRLRLFNDIQKSHALTDERISTRLLWSEMRAPLQAHIESMRDNIRMRADTKRYAAHADLYLLKKRYYSQLTDTNEEIRKRDHNTPLPEGRGTWQEWIPKDIRLDYSNRFNDAYLELGESGSRLIPFAPPAYRRDNMARITRNLASIKAERAAWNPECAVRVRDIRAALILCACMQAEREIKQYVRGLKTHILHPYETPAKVHWAHYCEKDLRKRVYAALRGQHVTSDGLDSFYIG